MPVLLRGTDSRIMLSPLPSYWDALFAQEQIHDAQTNNKEYLLSPNMAQVLCVATESSFP